MAAVNIDMTDRCESDEHITHTVDQFLSKRPRRSYPKACHPCRRRKVRCNNAQPCSNCISRDYPELCYYAFTEAERGSLRQRRRRNGAALWETNGKDQVTARRSSRLLEFERELHILERTAFTEAAPSVKAKDGHRSFSDSVAKSYERATHRKVSSAATTMKPETEHPPHQQLDERCVRTPTVSDTPYMADAGNIHPFENLWQPGSSVREVAMALPSDEIFTRYLEAFYEVYQVAMPCGPMLELREDARRFWRARSLGNYVGPELQSTSWLALLFSCLAFGSCFADPSSEDTQLNANIFVCCAFQLLRLDNYLLAPKIEHILALSTLGGCLRGQANPDASWSLLGTTIRLAQRLGLHQQAALSASSTPSEKYAWHLWYVRLSIILMNLVVLASARPPS
ncbi:hypothetical protein PV08_11337 [Exophiala spinifera]|uniref:Zn(2)-C6 fungal-type domain-containing protein n=1 Tax=Exophiala spinifera TaxID=91928 RepID=A0A0D2AV74_9EURO|nr:uncharacterized protein PV08_11337 [Exophiala spinifera]KIW10375.1 hypothetical protein PV08_11337 [Exophiala spinifera]